MSTPTTTKIDILLMLGRLVPKAEYGWKGNGYGVYADIGDWRNAALPKPTEAQIYAAWDTYLSEKAQSDAVLAARLADFQEVIGAKADSALTAIDAEITLLNGAPSNAQVIAILKANEQRQRAVIKAFQHLVDILGA